MALSLVDTEVAVDFLRGNVAAIKFFEDSAGSIVFSVVTHAEIFAGARNEEDRKILDEFLRSFPSISLNPSIAREAGLLKQKYSVSHGLGLADALIAAAASSASARLASLNEKHFRMQANLVVPYRRS